jgi:hypothetical protein
MYDMNVHSKTEKCVHEQARKQFAMLYLVVRTMNSSGLRRKDICSVSRLRALSNLRQITPVERKYATSAP